MGGGWEGGMALSLFSVTIWLSLFDLVLPEAQFYMSAPVPVGPRGVDSWLLLSHRRTLGQPPRLDYRVEG